MPTVTDTGIMKEMKRIQAELGFKAMKKALLKGSKVVAKKARYLVPIDTGLLKKSIKTKSARKTTSAKCYADPMVFGARKNAGASWKRVNVKVKKRGVSAEKIARAVKKAGMELKRPSKYAHLVEFGSKKNSPMPFMRPALHSSKQQAFDLVKKEAAIILGGRK
jgi:HK97 gp10 family phage protein